MSLSVIGMDAEQAQRTLAEAGVDVKRVEYAAPRGVADADSARVIRVRELGNNSIEITVAYFKTRV